MVFSSVAVPPGATDRHEPGYSVALPMTTCFSVTRMVLFVQLWTLPPEKFVQKSTRLAPPQGLSGARAMTPASSLATSLALTLAAETDATLSTVLALAEVAPKSDMAMSVTATAPVVSPDFNARFIILTPHFFGEHKLCSLGQEARTPTGS